MTTSHTSQIKLSMTPLFSVDDIAARIKTLASEINRDYQGKEILMIAVLKGSFLFIADLIRAVETPSAIDFVRLASYGSVDNCHKCESYHLEQFLYLMSGEI